MSLLPIFSGIDPNKNVSHSSTVNSTHVVAPPKPVVAAPVLPPPSIERAAIEKPPARKMTGRGMFSTPSILDALKSEPDPDKKANTIMPGGKERVDHLKALPFSEEDLLDAWKNFVVTIDTPQLKVALSAREPQLSGEWQIEYELDTELQYNRLTLDLKPKLLGYLRRHFNNEAIEIQFKISEGNSNTSDIPYTDSERWNSLVEKYPALATLKSKFGLDFEHF